MRDKIEQLIAAMPRSEAIFEVTASTYDSKQVSFDFVGTKVSNFPGDDDLLKEEIKRQWSESFNKDTLSFEPHVSNIIESVEYGLRSKLLQLISNTLDQKDVRATNLYKFYNKYAFRGLSYKFDEGLLSLLRLVNADKKPTVQTITGVLELFKMKYEDKLCEK